MPKHSLFRLTRSLYNTPHLADRKTFDSVISYLDSRNSAGLSLFPEKDEDDHHMPSMMDPMHGIGVITIQGPLTYRTTGWEAACGGFSYEMLLEQTSEMIEHGCKTIVLDVDSGGGEAYGCFESVSELRKMCDEADVKLYGYIDGMACSAAYAIICACDEVHINPFGEAGSIGVLICLYNDSKHLEQEGFKRIFITDGSEKVPFDSDGEFKDSFLADLQEKVTKLGDAFREHVSMHTGLSVEDVKNTNAKVFCAEDAQAIGLVNKITTRSDFVEYVVEKHKGASNA